MIEATVVAGAGVQGESGCNGAPLVRFSQEDQLLKRLEEVERYDVISIGRILSPYGLFWRRVLPISPTNTSIICLPGLLCLLSVCVLFPTIDIHPRTPVSVQLRRPRERESQALSVVRHTARETEINIANTAVLNTAVFV